MSINDYMDTQLGIKLVIAKLQAMKEPVTPEIYLEIQDADNKEISFVIPDQLERKNMCKIMGFSTYVYNGSFKDPQSSSTDDKKTKLGTLQFILEDSDNTVLLAKQYSAQSLLKRIQILMPTAKQPDEKSLGTKQIYIFQDVSLKAFKDIPIEDKQGINKYYKVFEFKYFKFAMKNTLYDSKTQDQKGNIYSLFEEK